MNGTRPRDDRLFIDEDMTAPVRFAICGGTAFVFSARCPTKNTANEDAAAGFSYGERSGVLAITDGLGGSAVGEKAAKIALEALQASVDTARTDGTLLRSGIITGIERANSDVQSLATGAATTLAVVEINDGQARPYHVGDSSILIVGGRGKVKVQTVPHSPVGYGMEAGLLNEVEAMQHEHRHVVSNVIGSAEMHITIGPAIKLAPRDTVLLASDGLFDNVYLDSIVHMIRKGDLASVAARMVQETKHQMDSHSEGHVPKPDDLTFILFRLTN